MKLILLFFSLFVAYTSPAQSPAYVPKQAKAIPAVNRSVSLTPPIDKIVGPPKEINKKKRKPVPVTAAAKVKPQALSKSKQ